MKMLLSFLFTIALFNFAYAEEMICDGESSSGNSNTKTQVKITHDLKQVYTITKIETTKDNEGDLKTVSQIIFSRTYDNPLNRGGYVVSYCNPDESTIADYTGNMSINSNCTVNGSSDQVYFSFYLKNKSKTGEYSIDYLGEDIISTKQTLKFCK